jgi:hypothetical protein
MDDGQNDIVAKSKLLVASARTALVHFLLIELEVATTMLEAARATDDPKLRDRRRLRATQACDTVTHHLSTTGAQSPLPQDARTELVAGLDRLRRRLAEPH